MSENTVRIEPGEVKEVRPRNNKREEFHVQCRKGETALAGSKGGTRTGISVKIGDRGTYTTNKGEGFYVKNNGDSVAVLEVTQ